MNPVILFRKDLSTEEELSIARHNFLCKELRTEIPTDSLVIARYSALPFYRELELDLKNRNCSLINSYHQHRWIADFDWYQYLKEYTPESWFQRDIWKASYDGPFVLKGVTNSRKHQWKTHMYAENLKASYDVASRLGNDPLIGQQEIIYRKYIPLKLIETDPIYGCPYVNEWRLFYYKDKLLSKGFYWTTCEYPEQAEFTEQALELANKCAKICAKFVNFFVLDVAETAEGDWILIEVNDGQMSGLSDNDPWQLYQNLKKVISYKG